MKRKIISLVLVLCMIVTFVPCVSAAKNGTCGDNLTWELNENGTLTIIGTGAMTDYTPIYEPVPWGDYLMDITSVVIDDGVTNIGDYAFWSCDSLTKVIIPDSVMSIGDYAFSYCESLISVTIPNGVASMEDGVFYHCINLISVTIGNCVTDIGEWAFYNCYSLTDVEIPDSVTNIGMCAFGLCYGLTNIDVEKNNKNYCSLNGNLFSNDRTTLIQYAIGKTDTQYFISDGVINVGDYAFWGCENLISLTIPDNTTHIGKSAFSDCCNLKSISIPDSITNIGEEAFYYCNSLTNISIPVGVEHIENSVFEACDSLVSVTIPSSVTNIGKHAFYHCDSLTSILIPDSVMSIGEYAFLGCSGLTDVYYSGSAEEWNDIDIAEYNNSLGKVVMHYDSSGLPEAEFSTTIENNEITVENISEASGKIVVITAMYDNNVLINIESENVTISAGEGKSFTIPENGKVFVWNSLEEMKPI